MLKELFGFGEKNIGKSIDIVDKGVGGIISGLDAAWYTDEEKSQMAFKGMQLKLETLKAIANENSDQSKTRRFVACSIIAYSLFMVTVISAISFQWPEKAKTITQICVDWNLPWAFFATVGFFFSNHVIGSYQKNKK